MTQLARFFPLRPLMAGFLLAALGLLSACASRGPVLLAPAEPPPPPPPPVIVSEPLVVTDEVAARLAPEAGFQLGIDRARERNFAELRRQRVTLVTDVTALDSRGQHVAELFASQRRFTISNLVLIDDGLTSQTTPIRRAIESRPGLRVHVLNRAAFRPTDAMLRDTDRIVFDAALRGYRQSVELAALGAVLEEASLRSIPVTVYDRPPLLDADKMAGPVSVLALAGTIDGFLPLPIFPALTTGELAEYLNREFGIQARLDVVEMNNWKRADPEIRMVPELPGGRTPEGEAALAELLELPGLSRRELLLRATELLVGNEAIAHKELAATAQGPALHLYPGVLPNATVLERLTTFPPEGVDISAVGRELDGEKENGVAIRVRELARVNPVLLSLQLRVAIHPNVREYPPVQGAGEYGDAGLFDAFSLGLAPVEILRRVDTSEPMREFRRKRLEYMKYMP